MSEIIDVNSKEELETAISNNENVLVDFWAPWCGPCRMIAPMLAELATEDNGIVVVKINTDENPTLASELGIRSIPTLFKYKDGEKFDTQIGATSKNKLLEGFGEK